MVRSKEIVDPRATSAQSGVSQREGQVPLGVSKTTDAELLAQLAANARADKPSVYHADKQDDFPLRDMYNRLVNEIKLLAKQTDTWIEVEIDPVWQINREIQRIASIYDPWE